MFYATHLVFLSLTAWSLTITLVLPSVLWCVKGQFLYFCYTLNYGFKRTSSLLHMPYAIVI